MNISMVSLENNKFNQEGQYGGVETTRLSSHLASRCKFCCTWKYVNYYFLACVMSVWATANELADLLNMYTD